MTSSRAWMCLGSTKVSPHIGVGTGGARGGPAPPIYKSGGSRPPPPQCWSYQRYFNCENGLFYPHSSHFCNNFGGLKHKFQLQKFLLHALHTLKTGMCTHNYYVHMYMSPKKFGPPNIKHLPTPLPHIPLMTWSHLYP